MMLSELRFPLKDVKITLSSTRNRVTNPIYLESYWQMNQEEFAMQVEGVGSFYACNGSEVEYAPAEGAGINEIELYLNGSVYGAILHQRKILPFHGSSFRYNGKTVMVCGDTGAGKSSLTAAFCTDGAEFLTDDITPVLIVDGIPNVWPVSDRIKLCGDTLEQLELNRQGFESVYPGADKYIYPIKSVQENNIRLDNIFIIGVSSSGELTAEELNGPGKFAAIRGEIYRGEYLNGMPENEPVYFSNIVKIAERVRVVKIIRPRDIRIAILKKTVEQYLNSDMQNER